MITGDHAATAKAIARELGLRRPDSVLTGRDLDAIGDEALGEAVDRHDRLRAHQPRT